MSGQGVIHSFTINRYQLSPSMQPPYVLAEVEMIEQKSLILLTNIVNCAVEDVRIGMPVSVTFDHVEDAWIPVFQP